MSTEEPNRPEPSHEPPGAGQPEKKLTFLEKLKKKAAKLLGQSR